MRVLLDACVPERLRHAIPAPHVAETARYAGLSHLSNGALLAAASGRYDVFITTDKSLRHEQNTALLPLTIIVLASVDNDINALRPLMVQVIEALKHSRPGSVVEF